MAGPTDPEIEGVEVVRYYPRLDATRGRPFGVFLHGNEGTEGADGLAWVKAAEYVVVSGKPSKAGLESCWGLGATIAAPLMECHAKPWYG